MKKYLSLYTLLIAGLFYSCNDFQKIPDTDEGEGTLYDYCFFSDGGYCLTGGFTKCPRGGLLTNTCKDRMVQKMSYCVFDADSFCVVGGGDISECPENSRSQETCPYPAPGDTTIDSLPGGIRAYCEFTDEDGNKTCLPSSYPNGYCGPNAVSRDTCYFGDTAATVKNGLCNDEYYDQNTHFCGIDSVKQEEVIEELCGGKEYDVSSDKKLYCSRGQVMGDCGKEKYYDDQSFCRTVRGTSKVYDKCNGEEYNPESNLCLQAEYHKSLKNDSIILAAKMKSFQLKCGGKSYKPSEQFCPQDSIYALCGNSTYNIETEFCLKDTVTAKCNVNDTLKTYGEDQACLPEIGLVTKCVVTGKCVDNTPKCGGQEFDSETEFCDNGKVYPLCNGERYNAYDPAAPLTKNQRCGKDETTGTEIIQTLCVEFSVEGSSVWYNDKTDFCDHSRGYSMVVPKCDGKKYEVYKDSSVTVNKLTFTIVKEKDCPDSKEFISVCWGYDIETEAEIHILDDNHFCIKVENSFFFNDQNKDPGTYSVPLCGDSPYDVTRQFCYDDEVINYCGNDDAGFNQTVYDPREHHCGNANEGEIPTAIYLNDPVPGRDADDHFYKAVLIGNYYYFTENLKWQTEGSVCFNEDCDTYGNYGRYYVAGDVIEAINNADKLCPLDWSVIDYESIHNNLVNYVQKISGSSWGSQANAGIDFYGFNALPGGSCSSNGCDNEDNSVAYWHALEGYVKMTYSNPDFAIGVEETSLTDTMYPVRCVKSAI